MYIVYYFADDTFKIAVVCLDGDSARLRDSICASNSSNPSIVSVKSVRELVSEFEEKSVTETTIVTDCRLSSFDKGSVNQQKLQHAKFLEMEKEMLHLGLKGTDSTEQCILAQLKSVHEELYDLHADNIYDLLDVGEYEDDRLHFQQSCIDNFIRVSDELRTETAYPSLPPCGSVDDIIAATHENESKHTGKGPDDLNISATSDLGISIQTTSCIDSDCDTITGDEPDTLDDWIVTNSPHLNCRAVYGSGSGSDGNDSDHNHDSTFPEVDYAAVLRDENSKLTRRVAEKNEQISRLQYEKTVLVKELLSSWKWDSQETLQM